MYYPQKIEITYCKLKKKSQKNYSIFCTGSNYPFRCRYFGYASNSSALFHRQTCQVASHHLTPADDEVFDGSVKLDESCFSARREGWYGRGAAGKVAVFGILNQHGKICTVVADNAKLGTLLHVIKRKFMPDSIVCTTA
ncbi:MULTISPECIES: hypothetical protein [unclassified Neisseria]|uniref:hypothetical protein n=1 Tax=unclassified Neisseria TaxID=2623750 RepID=UPI00107265E3|nr:MULTISPECIES: hypothetical protein [unclassified Neisseria]MBF0805027.1 hypothetical protein [Neisseria sp. 19428wB4_WF04]TFU39225.1 hypothetical protein E4T99_12210 [Neisseria sp. WF04]